MTTRLTQKKRSALSALCSGPLSGGALMAAAYPGAPGMCAYMEKSGDGWVAYIDGKWSITDAGRAALAENASTGDAP